MMSVAFIKSLLSPLICDAIFIHILLCHPISPFLFCCCALYLNQTDLHRLFHPLLLTGYQHFWWEALMGGTGEPRYFSLLSASDGILGWGCTSSLALCSCGFMSQYISPFFLIGLFSLASQIILATLSFIWSHIVTEKICPALFLFYKIKVSSLT